jgi:hypothetical protein
VAAAVTTSRQQQLKVNHSHTAEGATQGLATQALTQPCARAGGLGDHE